MNIFIDNKPAVLKKGSSFDFVFENRYFTGADSYTLNIVFPLRGCKENIAIFGHINRKDVAKERIAFDCRIIDRDFSVSGVIAITEISDVEVKTQFLEGRSADNYLQTLEDIYINELSLGYPESDAIADHQCWARQLGYPDVSFVALPWVNNNTGNIQNDMNIEEAGLYSWNCERLSFQPYLIQVAKRICAAIGYTWDFTPWEESDYKYLLVCNALPYTWNELTYSTTSNGGTGGRGGNASYRYSVISSVKGSLDFAVSLPHWSVIEFFEQIGYLLGADFEFDHKRKTVSFGYNTTLLQDAGTVKIDKVVDSFSGEITSTDESEYIESASLKYKDCSHEKWKVSSCSWFMEKNPSFYTFDTVQQMVSEPDMQQMMKVPTVTVMDRQGNYLLGGIKRNNKYAKYPMWYCKDVDMYFTLHCYGVEDAHYTTAAGQNVHWRLYELIPVNNFGERVSSKDCENSIELGIVPAWIDSTDKGNVIFLDVPEKGSNIDEEYEDPHNSDGSINWNANTSNIIQPSVYKRIKEGDQDKSVEYFDKLYVAYWNGKNYLTNYLPCPQTDRCMMNPNWTFVKTNYSLRLRDYSENKHQIEGRQKYKFSFLSSSIPNPRAVFYIHGQKYLCSQLTVSFKEDGRSQLIKGVFYKLVY